MDKALYVGLGGFAPAPDVVVGVGSVLRYWLGGTIQQIANNPAFPLGTLVVNLAGCLLIGFLSQLADARGIFPPEARLFIFTGLLGGFTTFSAFGNESVNLLRNGENLPALLNVGIHVFAGLGAVWLGRALAHQIWG